MDDLARLHNLYESHPSQVWQSFLCFTGIGSGLHQNTFNHATLRMLKSIQKVESHEHFKSFSWPVFGPFDLTHKEKLVVAQPGSCAPEPSPGERRYSSVEEAIGFCIFNNFTLGKTHFSILVHEGTYFNPVPQIIHGPTKDFTLEIIGTKNVRFILCNPFSKLITIVPGKDV